MSFGPQEVSWENLDKKKFYTLGIGVFSGVTTCLYPLTVIKTRQIAGPLHLSGLSGVQYTVSEIWRNDRIRGFYKGFGTVCLGAIPARVVYMSALELVKSGLHGSLNKLGFSDVAMNGAVNFVAGASAALASQIAYVPVDVVSQRLMVLNRGSEAAVQMHGLSMARLIIQQEGLRGLWKGLFASIGLSFFFSIGTYVPNSAVWWGSYGFLQKLLWKHLDWIREGRIEESTPIPLKFMAASDSIEVRQGMGAKGTSRNRSYATNDVIAVQTTAALLSGVTAALFTTPLDVVKTRMQLTINEKGKTRMTSLQMCRQIWVEHGAAGFMRGVLPRAANVSLWGTCMVSAYEFLKRASALPG